MRIGVFGEIKFTKHNFFRNCYNIYFLSPRNKYDIVKSIFTTM